MTVASLSTSTKLAALLFAAIFVPTITLLGFMNLASTRALAGQQEELVEELRSELIAEYSSSGPSGLVEAIRDRIEFDPHGDEIIAYSDPFGRMIIGDIEQWPQIEPGKLVKASLRRVDQEGDVLVLLNVDRLPDGSLLLAGHAVGGNAQLEVANEAGLLLAVLLAIPLSLGLAFVLLRVIERRAGHIATVAERFGAGDLKQRMPVGLAGDAFDRLARALNAMLDRIENLVGELRLVTDGLAHDLRSPVTRLRSAVEQAAAVSGDATSFHALGRAVQEARSLETMLTTALQISRAEAGIGRDRLVPVDVAAMLRDLEEIYGPQAEEAGFELVVDTAPDLIIPLQRELMGQAIGNLIENAVRYAEGGNRVELVARRQDGTMDISVTDNGPGIPPERRAEALRRFGRLDPARHLSGTGLGLALAEAVAKLHHGRLTLEDQRPGLRATFTLPVEVRST